MAKHNINANICLEKSNEQWKSAMEWRLKIVVNYHIMEK